MVISPSPTWQHYFLFMPTPFLIAASSIIPTSSLGNIFFGFEIYSPSIHLWKGIDCHTRTLLEFFQSSYKKKNLFLPNLYLELFLQNRPELIWSHRAQQCRKGTIWEFYMKYSISLRGNNKQLLIRFKLYCMFDCSMPLLGYSVYFLNSDQLKTPSTHQ